MLKPELAAVVGAERFPTEIKTTANLKHPHILPLHDSGKRDEYCAEAHHVPEGVGPDDLAVALEEIAIDDFAERRNAWVVGTYRAYLKALDEMGRVDLRSVPARLADAIDAGALPAALGGAGRLHVYGLLFFGNTVVSRRAIISFQNPGNCVPAIFLDGFQVEGILDHIVHPEDVEAIEAYAGISQIPPRWLGSHSVCGVVVIWTRRGGGG